MHAAYLFIVSGHFPLKSFRTSNMQPVTFAPSFKHISGSWFPFLHAKYAAVWFAHLFCKCLCEANKTLDVGALSFSDMIFLLNSATKLYYTHKQQQHRSDWLRFSRDSKNVILFSLSLSLSINTGVRSQNTLSLSLSLHTLSLSLYTLSFSLSLLSPFLSLSRTAAKKMMMMMSALSCTLLFVSFFRSREEKVEKSFLGFRRRPVFLPVFLANNNNKKERKKTQRTTHSSFIKTTCCWRIICWYGNEDETYIIIVIRYNSSCCFFCWKNVVQVVLVLVGTHRETENQVVCCGLAGDITSRSFFDFRRRKRSRSGIIETE